MRFSKEKEVATTKQHGQILQFLSELRDSHEHMEWVFMQGSCYHLYAIMKVLWPEANPWIIPGVSHVLIEVDGYFYDIRGWVGDVNESDRDKLIPIHNYTGRDPLLWRNRKREKEEGFQGIPFSERKLKTFLFFRHLHIKTKRRVLMPFRKWKSTYRFYRKIFERIDKEQPKPTSSRRNRRRKKRADKG